MAQYRKLPLTVDAVRYAEYGKLVRGMCNSQSCFVSGNIEPHVHTIHNDQIVNLEVGDWIVAELDGVHFYPIKPDMFAAGFELV